MRNTIKNLPENSDIKEDLQEIYEVVQEISYADYNILKTLEILGVQTSELQKTTSEHTIRSQQNQELSHDEHKQHGEEHQEQQERVLQLSYDIQHTLDELKAGLVDEYSEEKTNILRKAPIILEACKQVLVQSGYDPDTGLQKSEIDRDWKKLKTKAMEFLITSLFAVFSGWLVREYAEKRHTEQKSLNQQVQQQLQETITELRAETQKLRPPQKN